MMQCDDNFDAEQCRFAADLLRARVAELAETAARAFVQAQPRLAARYAPDPFSKWREHMAGRLSDLAAAICLNAPGIFGLQVAWTRQAFVARGVPTEDLVASLDVLEGVLIRELPEPDLIAAKACFAAARDAIAGGEAVPPASLSVATTEGRLAAEYLVAILEGDRRKASRLVMDAVQRGMPVRTAYLQVLLPVQREVGRMWHINELSVAEEHFATSTTRAVMAQLMSVAAVAPANHRVILLAAVEGNTHDLGVRAVADFFEMAGWRVIELGANVPAADLVRAAIDYSVDIVAISAAMPSQIGTIEASIAMLRAQLGDSCPPVIVGGTAFCSCEEVWHKVGAAAFTNDIDEAIAAAARLVQLD
jgi:methanogenic corrinoid protein MtbC1